MPAITIYTIGHSDHPLERFVGLLRRFEIGRLVDVRSRPYSRWAPHFRKRPLAEGLMSSGMSYVFMGETLGGRPAGEEFYDAQGRVDYVLRARCDDFQAGIERLLQLAAERPTVIMCAEEDPMRCHRRGLISPALRARGIEVAHIRGDGRLQVESDDQAPDGQLALFS